MVVTSGVPTFPHLAAQRPGPAPVCGAWHRLQGFASCPSGHGHRSKLVGGDPQLLAAGGVPWRFMPLCCGSQRGPGCPALPKGRPVAPSGDLWSGCGQCPPTPALGTHSIPGRPPGLLTGTAHRPLPGGLHSFLPGLLPCQAGLAAPSRCSPLCLEERKSGPRLCPGVQAGPVLTTVASGWLLPGDALRVSASESYTV